MTLDRATLPGGARLIGGTLAAPVAPDAGTRSPDGAALRACLVTETFTAAEGSFAAAPAVDCKTSSPGVYRPGSPRASFAFDLRPFTQRWAAGTADRGIALLPAESAAGSASWHVAFDGKGRPDGQPITATLDYELSSTNGGDFDPATPPAEPTGDFLPPSGVTTLAAPPAPTPAPPVLKGAAPFVSPVAAPPPAFDPTSGGFEYPAAFLLPLVLLLLGGFLARAFTRPIPSRFGR